MPLGIRPGTGGWSGREAGSGFRDSGICLFSYRDPGILRKIFRDPGFAGKLFLDPGFSNCTETGIPGTNITGSEISEENFWRPRICFVLIWFVFTPNIIYNVKIYLLINTSKFIRSRIIKA